MLVLKHLTTQNNQGPQFLITIFTPTSCATPIDMRRRFRQRHTNGRLADNLKKIISTLVIPRKRISKFTPSQVTLYLSRCLGVIFLSNHPHQSLLKFGAKSNSNHYIIHTKIPIKINFIGL